MQWLRNWLSKRSNRPAKVSSTTSNGFRPQVESLDGRVMPSVSSLALAGGTITVAVSTDNELVVVDPVTQNQSGTGIVDVRTAQLFRDPTGSLGIDIVFNDGSWQHIETGTGNTFLFSAADATSFFGNPLLDVGSIDDGSGGVAFTFLVSNDSNTDQNALGFIAQFDSLSGLTTFEGFSTTIRWVSTYETTTQGISGLAFGQVTAGDATADPFDDQILAQRVDGISGLLTLYQGSGANPAAVAEYSQSVLFTGTGSLLNPTAVASVVATDVTLEGLDTNTLISNAMGGTDPVAEAGYAIHFTMGDIATGTGAVSVMGNGNIKTGVLQAPPV